MSTTVSSSTCSCVDNTQLFKERSNCQIEETGKLGILTSKGVCYPLDYGSNNCAPHDLNVEPRCTTTTTTDDTSSNLPDWCREKWCYVDPDKCRLSPELVFRGVSFEDTYYSYSICNATADSFLQYQTTQSLTDQIIRVTIPVMRDKAHYKLTEVAGELASSTGPEYYNDTIPWRGYMIDYFNAVVGISDMKGVHYTYRTIGADQVGLGAFTGVVHDVQAGMTDVALSTYWITSDRLQMTPYTTPVFVDQVLLWVPQPELQGGSLKDNVSHVFAPFDNSLWIALGILILVVASVNIWLSTTRGVHSYLSRRVRGPKWRKASPLDKVRISSGMILDSLMIFSTYFFGHSVELDWQSTRAQKVLMVGFGFLILIAVASYTANLAAFLTVTGVSNYISSMEEAIYTNTPICAHPQLQNELASVWPAATFVFNPQQPNTGGIIKNYKEGKCKIIASSMLEIRQYLEYMDEFCQLELVSTGALVLENPIAFPVNSDYSGGLSYWLFRAEKQGITLQSFIDAGVPPPTCNLKLVLSDTENELASLSMENFALPFIFCGACIILSIVLHLCFNKPGDPMMNESSLADRKRVSRHPISSRDPNDETNNDEHDGEEEETYGDHNNNNNNYDDYMAETRFGKRGIGAIRDQSIVDSETSLRRRHVVGSAAGIPANGIIPPQQQQQQQQHRAQPDPMQMHQQLQEVIATQKMMLSLMQQGKAADATTTDAVMATSKEEEAPTNNDESIRILPESFHSPEDKRNSHYSL